MSLTHSKREAKWMGQLKTLPRSLREQSQQRGKNCETKNQTYSLLEKNFPTLNTHQMDTMCVLKVGSPAARSIYWETIHKIYQLGNNQTKMRFISYLQSEQKCVLAGLLFGFSPQVGVPPVKDTGAGPGRRVQHPLPRGGRDQHFDFCQSEWPVSWPWPRPWPNAQCPEPGGPSPHESLSPLSQAWPPAVCGGYLRPCGEDRCQPVLKGTGWSILVCVRCEPPNRMSHIEPICSRGHQVCW